MLSIQNLTVNHGTLTALSDVSVSIQAGQWLMIAGANGAGKSTFVHAIAQSVPYQGIIRYQGRDIKTMRPNEIAREIAFLSQRHQVNYAFTVEEVVTLGRFAHRQGFFSATDAQGERKVHAALEMTGMLALKDQSMLTLSGGEVQRTFLAQVFAQDPNLIILDEPTNHLDLKYQKQTFELIQEWITQPNRAAVSVVHDIGMARAFGTHAMLLERGKMIAYGDNRTVLSRNNLMNAYGMDVEGWMRTIFAQWEA